MISTNYETDLIRNIRIKVQNEFETLKYYDLFEFVIKNISQMKLPDDLRRFDS
jgi:hypothetical protein